MKAFLFGLGAGAVSVFGALFMVALYLEMEG